MNEIPGARVVRGGESEGGRRTGAEVTPEGRVLRLAPRAVPRALAWRLLFGGWLIGFGWMFAAFGMVFALLALQWSDLSFLGADYDRQATATVTSIEQTSSSENKRKIYRVHYTFVDESGVERRGESYTKDPPREPASWQVEYRSGDPSESRLAGMRTRPFSPFLLMVLIFPLVGLGLVLWQLPTALHNLRLLRYGAETKGKLVDKRPTHVEINNAPVMALTFEYEVDGKPYRATVKTLTTAPLEDDAREPMLYDPQSPSRAMTLDHLPGSPKVTADGELEARSGVVLHLLIAPLLFVGLVVASVILML